MTYTDSVQYLYSLGNELKIGAKWDLDRIRLLLERLGHPERLPGLIHVAGTNGKGSTAAMIASILEHTGKRTGLFTSPHLISPTERIQINGKAISEARFARAFDAIHSAAEQLESEGSIDAHPSYFETVTAMAFFLFAGGDGEPPCETSVIEVGLGGRLDATNVIDPRLTVITPISFDHESFLGNTIESIAGEKAGIIKPNVPVVVSEQSEKAMAVLQEHARVANAPVLLTGSLRITDESFSAYGCLFRLDGDAYECSLPGRHQLSNALAAVAACRELKIPAPAIRHALRTVRWPGRLEYMRQAPAFILDGAHNPAGAAALASYIHEFLSNDPVWIVYGAMRDKAIDEVVETLFPFADRLILTAPDLPRALRPEAIAEMARRPDATIAPEVTSAMERAAEAPTNAAVVFTGSLFLVGEVRAALLRKMNSTHSFSSTQ